MNVIKFRPVGQPSGKVVRVRVSQSKRAIYARHRKNLGKSVAMVDKMMDRKGFVRAGIRHG